MNVLWTNTRNRIQFRRGRRYVVVSWAAQAGKSRPVLVLNLSDYREGPVEDWLMSKGFVFEKDAKRRDRIDLDFTEDTLVIEAKTKVFGLLANESINLPTFSQIQIEWGVSRFPKGASYERKIRNEALMIYVFMGDEKMPSGAFFIPNSPFFIALYLCEDDRVNHPYVGRYFKKSGRYVCLDRPAPGEMVISTFDLLPAYHKFFDKEFDDDPAISGIALSVDTKKAGAGGKSSAFVKRITFFGPETAD